MKKALVQFFLIFTFIGCGPKITEIEIIERGVESSIDRITEDTPENREKSPLLRITPDTILNIYCRSDAAPGMFVNQRGQLEGFYIELERAIMKEMNQKYNLVSYSNAATVILKIKEGTAHSVIASPIISDNLLFENFSNRYETLEYVLFKHRDSIFTIPDKQEEIIKFLSGKRVGVQARGESYQLLREYKDINVVEYSTTTAALKALSRQEVDFVPEVKKTGLYNGGINNWNIIPDDTPLFYLSMGTAFSKKLDPSIVERYNTAIQNLIDNGYIEKLHTLYYGI